MHAYFLLGGDPKHPIIYDVERIRDGSSFTTRRVKAIQHGRPIFTMSVSFHKPEEGYEHHAPMPKVPPPKSLPSAAELMAQLRRQAAGEHADLLEARAPYRACARSTFHVF